MKELAEGELSQPGGIVATRENGVFVTDGMFTGGRLLKVGECRCVAAATNSEGSASSLPASRAK